VQKELQQVNDTLKTTKREFDNVVRMIHGTDIQVNDYTNQARTCKERADEEFDFDVTDKEAMIPEVGFNPSQAKQTVRKMKSDLDAMGAVNLLASEEYEKEKERLEFLKKQHQDLLDSQSIMGKTIEEINDTACKAFLETFGKIRESFITIFRSLFEEGDKADLHLEEGDPLEAQITITARPRGKRPHSIEMLSGGEKTMTAIALLFSIYLVKPSPFCILDEVDAPLDDANVTRFVRLIRKFSTDTQFILITHNKRTMEATDALYGVTMEEEGVSRVVSVETVRNKTTEAT
jgi:chromosome segregation protein